MIIEQTALKTSYHIPYLLKVTNYKGCNPSEWLGYIVMMTHQYFVFKGIKFSIWISIKWYKANRVSISKVLQLNFPKGNGYISK